MPALSCFMLQTLLFSLAPVFFVLGLGYVAGWRGWVDARATDMLGAFIAQFALPIALFLAIVSAPRELLALELLPTTIYGAVFLVVLALSALWARRQGFSPITAALYVLTVGMPNLGGIGLGLFQSLEGPGSEVSLAVANLVGTLTVMLFAFMRLEMQRGGHPSRALGAALLKPMTILPTLGFAIALAGLPFPALATAMLKPLAQATGGAGMFLTGVILSTQALRLTRASLLGVFLANILRPALAVALCLALSLPPEMEGRIVVAMAIPAGFVGTILSAVYGQGGRESGGVLVATTFASILTLPFWIAVATLLFGV
ncbi:AEC family transporter [Aureimonas sp. ME7]|uniref:AEC family transporter n=1 Tax=Aureimonas sp. ME7 TaxID=2744252 RepID=UPI0015F39AE2|nr:AEC family transporter [Aureimonas sp. ME7]